MRWLSKLLAQRKAAPAKAKTGNQAPAATETTPPGAEAYVRRCLEPAFDELEEPRTWRSDPSFQSVLDPLNQGDHRTAAREAEKLAARFDDFHLSYAWWGTALLAMGEVEGAREVLLRGIERSKRKFVLCERLGEVEWQAANLADAVYWWAQGVHCQETFPRRAGDVGLYLYLHYVADGMGLSDVAAAFAERVDAIRAGRIRLEPATAGELLELARREGTPEIGEVLEGLQRRHLE